MLKRATKKQTQIAMLKSEKILRTIRGELKKKGYHFYTDVVGSRRFNTILVEDCEPYDIDVRLCITTNTKEKSAQVIFDTFYEEFYKLRNDNISVVKGTQSIKCQFYNLKKLIFTIEYVIVREDNIIRLDKNTKKRHWVQLKKKYETIYESFENLTSAEKENLIENYVIPLKIINKNNGEPKDSISVFIEGYNNFVKENGL